MPRRIRTSREGFRQRLDYLVRERGIERVASSRGVTKRTVQRWLQEETTPSQAQREGIRRAGRRAGAPTLVQRRHEGRYTTAVGTGDVNVRRGIVEERRRVRNAAMADALARGDREALRVARSMRVNIDPAEMDALIYRRQMLRELTPLDGIDSWDIWRPDYEAVKAGRPRPSRQAGLFETT